jgi:hypothetical protein
MCQPGQVQHARQALQAGARGASRGRRRGLRQCGAARGAAAVEAPAVAQCGAAIRRRRAALHVAHLHRKLQMFTGLRRPWHQPCNWYSPNAHMLANK